MQEFEEIVVRPDDIGPFDIRDGRAMVSLGPVSSRNYCAYSCPFCYVHYEYMSYQRKSNDEIIEWLKEHRREYDIVYISGDTDSFYGAPRQRRAVSLIRRMLELDVDIMITTRAIIEDCYLSEIKEVIDSLREKDLNFYGCVSITQFSMPHVEPKPIPSVERRIEQLRKFKELGMVTVLAMRPFLPVVPIGDYKEILERAKNYIDIVLGKVWYADREGKMYNAILKEDDRFPSPVFVNSKMDFDNNNADWSVYEGKEIEELVQDFCDKIDVPFFMTSRPAIDWIRSERRRTQRVIGIGALNVNFLERNSNSKLKHSISEIDSNRDLAQEINSTIGENFINYYSSVFLGGGAFHVIECLRYLHNKEHLNLDYVGVSGKDIPNVKFLNGGYISYSVINRLKELCIGTKYVKLSKTLPGLTINRWSGSRYNPGEATRNNTTCPYANDELADFLESEDRELLVKYLSESDWIHLSSLFDYRAMRIVAKLLTAAKSKNPRLRISWDVGSLNESLLERKPIVRELLCNADFIVLNKKELYRLTGFDEQVKEEMYNVVKKLYLDYERVRFSLVVQGDSFDMVDIYWMYRDSVLARSIKHTRVTIKGGPIDITAASAYLSAAIIDAKLRPDTEFEMRESIQYGIDLVWGKLISIPEKRAFIFQKIRRKHLKKIQKRSLRRIINQIFGSILSHTVGFVTKEFLSKKFLIAIVASVLATIIGAYILSN